MHPARKLALNSPATRTLRVVFLNYHDFTSNSALHIFHLANRLSERGLEIAVAVPGDAAGAFEIGSPRFTPLSYRETPEKVGRFSASGKPVLLHAWTPRENVRRMTEKLCRANRVPYAVHLEDNEQAIRAARASAKGWWLKGLIERRYLSHPRRSARFLREAAGVSVLLDPLKEFVPAGVPSTVIWPACEPDLFSDGSRDDVAREALGLTKDDFVIFYPGNITHVNIEDVRSLYLAVDLLNRRNIPARLLRTGRVDEGRFVDRMSLPSRLYLELGFQPRSRIGELYRTADALVQPGVPGPFNDYRFPAKLPEFLASGRPIILPDCNLGRHLRDEVNCRLLTSGTPEEIASILETFYRDPAGARRIGAAGQAFARENFDWGNSADKLIAFYEKILGDK